ncbi:MAG: glycosyltransferase family 4 protein [Solirubrobacterales bacterium]
MRILSIGNLYPPHALGGYEVIWRSAVHHLRAAGHDVRVLAADWRRESVDDPSEDADVHRELRWYWHDHAFPHRSTRERVNLERENAAILDRHLAEFEPDVVSWWAMGGMSLSLIERVRRAGIPAAGFVIDDWMVYGPRVDGWQRLIRRFGPARPALERAAHTPGGLDLGSAATWCFVSEHCRRRAREAGWKLPSTRVVNAGIDAELFAGPPAPERPWRWRLVYVGRLDRRKGVHTAITALTHLPDQADLSIVGAGDDDYATELRELADSLGVGDRVHFERTTRALLPEVYAQADVALFPVEWEEPWGLVPLEAMAVGRPVVATGTGGSAEYLRDGENCLLHGAGDPQGLTDCVTRLAGDEVLRSGLRQAGLIDASRFTDVAYNEEVEAIHTAVAGEGVPDRSLASVLTD